MPISPWWWRVIERAYRSKKRGIVIRGGRRGGKSTTIVGRIAIAEMLAPWHVVPPGDVGLFAVVSADKEQAKERLSTCAKALADLEIPHWPTTERILLKDRPVGIKAIAATLQGVVSFTCIGFLCDEMARWRDKDTGSNPAKEVVSSLRPTMATMPEALGWYVSSPWSTIDLHHKMVEDGDTEAQCVFVGTTWEMNPSLTEAATHALEPDEESWRREYAAIPMSADETKFFPAAHIDGAAKLVRSSGEPSIAMGGGDFAFRKNSSAMTVLAKYPRSYRLTVCEERKPGAVALKPSVTITELVGLASMNGAEAVACDLHYIESVREVTDVLELPLLEFPTSPEGIAQAYVRTRVLFADGMIDLVDAPPLLLEQLKETVAQPTPAGGLSIRNPIKKGAHGDLVSALVAAVWAIEQEIPERDAAHGARRFYRDSMRPSDDDLTDLPPASWEE